MRRNTVVKVFSTLVSISFNIKVSVMDGKFSFVPGKNGRKESFLANRTENLCSPLRTYQILLPFFVDKTNYLI